jgi:hypothetical protein
MSIASVQSVPPATNDQSADANAHSPDTQNNSDSGATAEIALSEDVVEVHQDPDIRGQIIIQYLDPSKNVVLQVPSTEELSVERGIAQEFQQAAELRESEGEAVPGPEGDHHGD